MAKILTSQLEQTQAALEIELRLATQKLMETFKGLKGSDLVKSIEWEYNKKDGAFTLLALDYYQYVSSGRRARARKVPIEDLLKWIKDKGIPTFGKGAVGTAYAIQQSIYKRGIKAKSYEDPVIETAQDLTSETMAEDLSNYIVDDLVIILEQNK